MDEERRTRAERIAGHRFATPALLDAALTHPSYAAEHPGATGYDRLEFLGDAVLGFIVSGELYRAFPGAPEGELTLRKHHAVSGESLSGTADALGIGDLVRLGRGAESAGERLRASVLENVFEALVGALFLDGGLPAARAFVTSSLDARYSADIVPAADPKSALQQLTQARHQALPEYRIVDVQGPPHRRTFFAEVSLGGEVCGRGSGASKQSAEKAAAASALSALDDPADEPPDTP